MSTAIGRGQQSLLGPEGQVTGCVVELLVEVDTCSGEARAVQLTVRGTRPGMSVTESALRALLDSYSDTVRSVGDKTRERVRVGALLDADAPSPATKARGHVQPDAVIAVEDGSAAVVEFKATRRSRLTDADLGQIAAVYMAANDAGISVLDAVAATRGVSRSQAGWLIQRAREGGFLPPARGRGRQKT
jgi:hypothetical protein